MSPVARGLPPRTTDRGRDERGDTLVEMLITIVLVGIVATAILGALMIAIHSSTVHRDLSTDDTLARSALETIKSEVETPQKPTTFPDCTKTSNAVAATLSSSVTLPTQSGYTVAISSVNCWDPVKNKFDARCTAFSRCNPSGLWLVTVTVTDPTGYSLHQSTAVRNPNYVAYSGY
jgi:type II secretory pathway pseudopilin PulG